MVVVTSCSCGTLPTVTVLSAIMVAARRGSTAFFAPEMRISPRSCAPPLMISLSKRPPESLQAWILFPLLRRIGMQGQGVDLRPHEVAEVAVHHLMLLDGVQADERLADDDGLEMVAVTLDGDLAAGNSGLDEPFDFVRLHGDHIPI